MVQVSLICAAVGALALVFAGFLTARVLRLPAGTERMQEIARAIQEGARAYLNRQYRTIAVFALLIFALLWAFVGTATAISFLAGAACSAVAGYVGMNVTVRSNVRVAAIARTGVSRALSVAVQGGEVNGLAVAGLALLALSVFYAIWRSPEAIVGLGFGASLISLFARIGGGIYTKAADVGADLVGKVEAGIPEDDPRNPAVIADNVGDNVGDCAGMGADLFETYIVTGLAAMLLGFLLFPKLPQTVVYPLALGAVAIVASILGGFFVRMSEGGRIMGALYRGLGATALLSALGFWIVTRALWGPIAAQTGIGVARLYHCTLIGISITFALMLITDFFTSDRFAPVLRVAQASLTGAGTNLIAGLSVGMESGAVPIALICAGILGAWLLGGLYGIGVAAMSMLSVAGMIVTLDSYGPITDNAGGIAEMADLDPEVRRVTDALDAVGNTTKATTKGFAIGSAALAALALFAGYVHEVEKALGTALRFPLSDPAVLVGLIVGGMLPFLFSSWCLRAVGEAAFGVVNEVRRQFREIPGIMEGTAKPDYGRCVDIVTATALRQMIAPGLLAVVAPLAVGFLLGPKGLGALQIGVIVSGLGVAMMLNNAGAAWDNAKKHIEEGNLGGKGSEAHKCAVVGDTVGDPCKDTAGPAINPLIKVMATISIIIAPLVVRWSLL